MRRAGSPLIGAITGAALAGAIGFFGFIGLSALHVLLVQYTGGNALYISEFYKTTGSGLLTGTTVAAALFGAWQGFERGGLTGGVVGGVAGPSIPLLLAAMVCFWALR